LHLLINTFGGPVSAPTDGAAEEKSRKH